MAELPNRAQLERQVARALSRIQRERMNELLELLGDPPDFNNVPSEFWAEFEKELRDAIRPLYEGLYIAAANNAIEAAQALVGSVGVDIGEIAAQAAAFASQQAFELVGGLTDTTRTQLQQKIAAFFEEDLTIPELTASLVPTFGPARSEAIAVTEVTRAHTAAERAVADELKKQGFRLVAIWNTVKDDHVDDICKSRDEKEEDAGGGWDGIDAPPAHVRCRCWLRHEIER